MPSAPISTTPSGLQPKKDNRPFFETDDGTRLDLVCEVVDELTNQAQEGNYDKVEEGLAVIKEMALRMEAKLRFYKTLNG